MIDTPSEINEFRMNKKQEEPSEDYDTKQMKMKFRRLPAAKLLFAQSWTGSRYSVGSE